MTMNGGLMHRTWIATRAMSMCVASIASAQSRSLDVDGARINYTVTGRGPVVVLLHGWSLDRREWTDQIAALSPQFTVVAVDRRGSGKSTGIADPTAEPGDVRTLLDTLHLRSATIIGHSAGAMVAVRFAAAMPERIDALVLSGGPSPAGFPGAEGDASAAARRAAVARAYGVDSMLREMRAEPKFRRGPRRTPQMVARVDSMARSYVARDLLEDHTPANRYPAATVADVRSWRFPILYIGGEWEAPQWHRVADSVTTWLPNARKVVIPGGGHAVHFDEPAAFNAALLDFLKGVKPNG
jgi:pimeloyl-ACP methyl ester carboxylesterase